MDKKKRKSKEAKPDKKPPLLPAIPESVSRREEALVPQDNLSRYIVRAKRYPLLTEEEELELVKRYMKDGDKEAAYTLVTSHLMLVVKIAMGFKTYYHNVMELIQEGNTGLMEAVKKFNPYKGARFSTYATWWIRALILKYIVDNLRIVRVGTTNVRRKLLFKLSGEINKLRSEGFPVQPKLLAERFNVKEKDVIDVSSTLSQPDISLNAPLSTDSKETFLDTFATDAFDNLERLEKQQLKEAFRRTILKFESTL
ncbi:MAG: sigma-70 family RNA polymerase sigma factor, partial [Nitrospinota bacterium]